MKVKVNENDKPRASVRFAKILACAVVLTIGVTTMVESVSLLQHFEPHLTPCLLNQCVQPFFWKEYWYFGVDVFSTILCLLIASDMAKAIFSDKRTNTLCKPLR